MIRKQPKADKSKDSPKPSDKKAVTSPKKAPQGKKPKTAPKRATKARAAPAVILKASEVVTVEQVKRDHGRPSTYSEDIATEVCGRLAAGETLRQICRDEHMPPESTVRNWALEDNHGFSARYARARSMGLDTMADEILDISDDASNDWMQRTGKGDEDLGWQSNGDHIQRSRLRVDSRKWLLSKMNPKKYGDKVEIAGDQENPIQHKHAVSWMTEEEDKARGWA